MRKSVIVINKGETWESWGQLTDVCKAHKEIEYERVKFQRFPFTEAGWTIRKIPYKVVGG